MMQLIQSYWAHYYTLGVVMTGTLLVGITAAGIGVFAVLRRHSLLGDAISHASLPGIALMFMYTMSTNPFVLLLGGGLAGSIGAFLVMAIARTTTLKQDALLGIILSVFFGFGVVLKTVIQKQELANQALLGKFFFGNAATLSSFDVLVNACVALFVMGVLIFFWKEFVLISFDPEFAQAIGYNVFLIEILLMITMVCAIVIGLHTVGVLLMSALLIAPAAAARQWTSSVAGMVWLSMFFGAVAAVVGSLVSSRIDHLPTGPTIVVCISIIVAVTFLCAPARTSGKGEA